MNVDIEEWARGARPALRALIEELGGDVAAFDADPRTAEPVLDRFLARLPWQEFEAEDWGWLASQLVAYLAEVLRHERGGTWQAVQDAAAPDGWRPVVAVGEGAARHVDLSALVYQELHPVPQRLPRMVARALALADEPAPR
ncbi:hypothetical protein [Streptomyces sp. NPDC053560]|uniref:hypothetical protein n=1 Tax=Streptomyces sp. NPDC053560 TaxID=3365711 RepID=UPI0037D8F087